MRHYFINPEAYDGDNRVHRYGLRNIHGGAWPEPGHRREVGWFDSISEAVDNALDFLGYDDTEACDICESEE